MLKNTDESIDSVATGIESLMDYHQLHRSEVEEDFVDADFHHQGLERRHHFSP